MSHRNSQQERNVRMYKTLAQTAGVVACLFFLLMLAGDGMPGILKGNKADMLLLALALVPVAGFVLTWFKEWPGAVLVTAGGLALLVYFFVKEDVTMALVYSMPFLITGALFMLHLKKKAELQQQHQHHHQQHK